MKGRLAKGVGSQSKAEYVDLVGSIEVAVEACCCL